jgi:hypothetical protein
VAVPIPVVRESISGSVFVSLYGKDSHRAEFLGANGPISNFSFSRGDQVQFNIFKNGEVIESHVCFSARS